jgi:hypothetical protein
MASLYESVTPRGDVLAGELTEALFAASLEEVVSGTAPATYGDPDAFFASTYPSGGLKSLLNEGLGVVRKSMTAAVAEVVHADVEVDARGPDQAPVVPGPLVPLRGGHRP